MPYQGLTTEGIETTAFGKKIFIRNWRPYSNKRDKRTLPISAIFAISEPLGNTIRRYSLDDSGIVTLCLEASPCEGDRLYVAMSEYLFQDEYESRAYVFQDGMWQEFADDEYIPFDILETWNKLDEGISGGFDV